MTKKDIFLKGLIMFLFFDLIAFICWSMSGQIPDNNLYLGIISKTFISLII